MRSLFLLPALIAALFATAAAAQPPVAAQRAYASGDFIEAANSAESVSTSESHAFAARALMAACMTASDRSRLGPLLDRAERAAREALRLDPASVEARLQYAVALGVRGRRATIAEAVARNYAPRGRRLIEEALTLDPSSAWGHALLGAWHLEVVRRGGRAGAVGYRARLATGLAEFERAQALGRNEPMIALWFAVALLETDSHRYASRAAVLLEQVAAASPRDAFERQMMRKGSDLAAVLERDGPAAADAAARRVLL